MLIRDKRPCTNTNTCDVCSEWRGCEKWLWLWSIGNNKSSNRVLMSFNNKRGIGHDSIYSDFYVLDHKYDVVTPKRWGFQPKLHINLSQYRDFNKFYQYSFTVMQLANNYPLSQLFCLQKRVLHCFSFRILIYKVNNHYPSMMSHQSMHKLKSEDIQSIWLDKRANSTLFKT